MLWTEPIATRLQARLAALLAPDATACHVPDLPLVAEACLVWALSRATGQTVVWVGDGPRTLEQFHRDLTTLAPPDTPAALCFPSWEVLPALRGAAPDVAVTGARLDTLLVLAQRSGPAVIATCPQALMELTLTADVLTALTVTLTPGAAADPAALAARLAEAGYEFVPEVQTRGEAAARGGILDAWPITESYPLRIEFVGNTVESIRSFDPLHQRSLERRTTARLAPAGEWVLLRAAAHHRLPLVRHLPPESLVVWSDIDRIEQHAAVYAAAIREAKIDTFTVPLAFTRDALDAQPAARQVFVGAQPEHPAASVDLDWRAVDTVVPAASPVRLHPDILEAARSRILNDLIARAGSGQQIGLFFDSPGTRDRFRELYPAIFATAGITPSVGSLSGGFASDTLGLVVVAESDLYGRKIQRRRQAPVKRTGPEETRGTRVSDWTEMEPGNLIVHVEHGIGRYLGLREIQFNGQLQEVLAIEYADEARLYVPVSQAHLLTRYIGVGKRSVPLHQIGGKRWEREKAAAEKAVHDLSAALLETQAARAALDGFACPPDTPWQIELEAAFPYVETPDQEQAITAVKQDLEARRPMDRLLCGDAGYGKTEVAVRAAFKTVMAGKQVAVLVPTTVLAQQHFQTFSERIAPFPVRIEMLSRFGSRRQNAATVAGLRDGTVDIVIGTHGLLQPDIAFHDLGLVIVDEEQRFGVLHKERFKHIRRLVDVLTLTATPIPRTLYMSLTGARDLSTIQTPPQERLAVETLVAPATDAVVREAVLRELNREGQVFYLHNRVRTIERVRERLAKLVPEARVEIAHGQMAAGQLAEVMRGFATAEFDVLLCTTIVESGLDIPNANTILIDRADRFGLAELYQLRGRVGRSKHKAYAYMLLPEHAHVDAVARKRIQAIRQYSGAGAGFRLALRDLEIRGAGNLLGHEQSGHIQAVGFGLYCQLLRRTVAQSKGEPLPPLIDVEVLLDFISLAPGDAGAEHAAVIPVAYIEDERLRVQVYRRIAEAAFVREIHALRQEIEDRFGPLPRDLARLLLIAELRVVAAARGVQSVAVEEDKIMLRRDGNYIMSGSLFPRLKQTQPDARLAELLAHVRRVKRQDR